MEAFSHIKTVIGIILSISIAHLLKGTVGFIQHPGRKKPYWVHLLWVFYLFLLLIHFWWWEFALNSIKVWSFPVYFFIILYIITYYIICALLYPDDLKDYGSYEAYFYSRKKWFFGILAFSFLADVVDTAIKGNTYFLANTVEYPARIIIHFSLCIAAIFISNKTFHAVLVALFIVYELSFILRLFMLEGAIN